MTTTEESNARATIREAHREISAALEAHPPGNGEMILDPPFRGAAENLLIEAPSPSEDPALSPKVRNHLVRLANAYQKGGKQGLSEKYNEMYPEKK